MIAGACPTDRLAMPPTQTGQHAVWLMNRTQFTGAIVLNSAAWWPSP